jgi:hypothetical protein
VSTADAELKKMVADHEGRKREEIQTAMKIQFEAMQQLAKKVSYFLIRQILLI